MIRRILIGFAIGCALLLFNDKFVFESVLVPASTAISSSSMEPTLLQNERLFLQKLFFKPIKRFDIVVLKADALPQRLIKRVIGLPGECVQLVDSYKVVINNLPMTYAGAPPSELIESFEGSEHQIQLKANPQISFETKFGATPLCLGKDEYYVLGDNRLMSGDSRFFGPINVSKIQGAAQIIWYSFDHRGRRVRWERLLKHIH